MPRRRDRLGTTRCRTSWSGRRSPDQPRSGSARPAEPHEDLRLAARPPLPLAPIRVQHAGPRRRPRSCRSSSSALLKAAGRAHAQAVRATAPECLLAARVERMSKRGRRCTVGGGIAPEFPAKRNFELIGNVPGRPTTRRLSRLANLRAADHEAESPALRLTRYFANRGLGQPTAATGQLVLVVRSDSGWAIATLGPQHLRGQVPR